MVEIIASIFIGSALLAFFIFLFIMEIKEAKED